MASLGTPRHETFRDEFGAIVEPNGLRSSAPRHDLIQHADHALGWERGINLNGQPGLVNLYWFLVIAALVWLSIVCIADVF